MKHSPGDTTIGCGGGLPLQEKYNLVNQELIDEKAFAEGLESHIDDLLQAIRPFIVVLRENNGRIPPERLTVANWNTLLKAFNAAKAAIWVED